MTGEIKDRLLRSHERMPEPSYIKLYREGVLQERARKAVERLRECRLCPRDCRVNRLEGEQGVCKTGRKATVSSFGPHYGEESPLVGSHGSGTVFFSSCNLLCTFCQNYDISHLREGEEVEPGKLAAVMLHLARGGCHNINFVTPSHVVPQILEALIPAVEGGLNVPLVYNTGGYDSVETLTLLDGVFDIYMPDFKFWDNEWAKRSAMPAITARGPWRPCGRCTGRWGIWRSTRPVWPRGGSWSGTSSCPACGGNGRGHAVSGLGDLETYLRQRHGPVPPLLEGREGRRDQPEDHPRGIRTGPGRGTSGGAVQAG